MIYHIELDLETTVGVFNDLARAIRELKNGISCCNHTGRETS